MHAFAKFPYFLYLPKDSQDGESEELIGEWMEAKGIRDQMVVATKVGLNFRMRFFRIPDSDYPERCSTQ